MQLASFTLLQCLIAQKLWPILFPQIVDIGLAKVSLVGHSMSCNQPVDFHPSQLSNLAAYRAITELNAFTEAVANIVTSDCRICLAKVSLAGPSISHK